MARRRMSDPNLWQSEDVSRLSLFARLLLVGMISHADDAGRGRASPNYLKSIVFPYDEISTSQVEDALEEITRNVTISVYKVHDSSFYQFDHWKKWQRVDKPQPSLIPAPGDLDMPCPVRTAPERVWKRKLDPGELSVKRLLDAQEKVRVLVPGERPFWEGSINGLGLLIRTNEYVEVPRDVAELIENNTRLLRESRRCMEAYSRQDKRLAAL